MRRGEIWSVRGESPYADKPRPAVIMQVRRLTETESVVVCLFTSYENVELSTRVRVEPSVANGLEKTSYIMVEKVAAIRQSDLGRKIGDLEERYLEQADTILKDLLGF